MRVLPAAVLALALALALGMSACATSSASPSPGANAPVTSAPFYLAGGNTTAPTVQVINGFTGRVEATIAAPAHAGTFPWASNQPAWGPCGAAPDDRTFLLCDTHQYWELRLGDNGKPRSMTGPASIPVAARNNGSNGGPDFAISADRRLAADITGTAIMVLSLVTGMTRSWTIPSADGYADSLSGLSWAGDRYVAFEFVSKDVDSDAGGVRVLDTASAATAALAASRLVISNEGKLADGITGTFNPVITSDGSKIVTAVWTTFNVAGLAEFSAQTGRLIAMLIPPTSMPGHGNPCQALWTDLSGAHVIAYCGTGEVINGTRSTPVNLHIPNASGITYNYGIFW